MSAAASRRLPGLAIAIGVCVLALATAVGAGEPRTRVRVGIEPAADPLSFATLEGKPDGFAVDLVNAIAAEKNLEITWELRPWEDLLAEFKAGRIDVIACMVPTSERARFADFTISHLVLNGSVFIRKADTSIRSPDDLRTKVIAAGRNGYSEEFARKNGWGHEFLGVSSLEEGLRALEEGRADALLAVSNISNQLIREHRYRHITTAPFQVDQRFNFRYHMAVRPDAPNLTQVLNSGLLEIRSNGIYDSLYERWIGPIEPKQLGSHDLKPYRLPILFLIILLGAVFWWQRRLLARLHRQKEELRDSEERLTLVIEGSQDAFWDLDLTTKHIHRTDRWAAILGCPPTSLPPTVEALDPLIHPDDLQRVRHGRESVLHQGHGRFEYRVRAADGRWRWILDRGKVVARDAENRPTRLTGAVTDITAQKQIGDALGRSQALLEQSQRAAEIGAWEYEVGTGSIYWTPQTYSIHDVDPEGEALTTDRILALYSPASREQMRESFLRAIHEAQSFDIELEVRTKHRVRWVRTIGHPDSDGGGVVRIYGSAQDITRQKREEDERQKLQLKMLEAQKLESLGVLAGGIAHDFNNLLTVILGNASVAREAPECAPGALQQIETAAQRAGDLCRQMLAYAGKSRASLESVDLNVIVSDTINLLKLSISKNATLDFALSPTPLQVDADTSQIRQVIMNFVINASDAIGTSPGRIRVSTSRTVVTAEMLHEARLGQNLPPGDYIAFEVEDNGCGMSPETMARIFDPFFTTKFAGRGLGLAAVLGILRTHRGAFFVTSTLGHGSTFRVLLPPGVKKPVPKPVTAAKRPSLGSGKGCFLVVDDEPSVRQLASSILEREGHSVIVASDGYEALALSLAHGGRFNAVLLDLTMPGLNGPATLRELRLMNSTLPVLLMSGFSEADARKHVEDDAMVAFLPKPFTAEDLLRHLGALLARVTPPVAPTVSS